MQKGCADLAFRYAGVWVRPALGSVDKLIRGRPLAGLRPTRSFTFAIRMAAVFMTSVSTTMLRTQTGPRVFAFLGYVLALVLLFGVEAFDWASLAFPLWALLISVLIMIRSFRRRSDTGNESVALIR